MGTRSLLCGCLTIGAIGLFVAGCGDGSPTKPSPPTPSEFAGIEVTGPDSLGAGQSAQFVANIRQTDGGTTKSATRMPNLRWRSSNPSVMFASSSGVVTASDSVFGESVSGEAVITAELTNPPGVQGTRKVVILPKAVITATLEAGPQGTPGQYVFALKFTESAGVPATVTDLWFHSTVAGVGNAAGPPPSWASRAFPRRGHSRWAR
jgi:hypothetical protein